mgnify:CR=1 FL=1
MSVGKGLKMEYQNPYKQSEKRWSWFVSQANLATDWRDQASFYERAWREAGENADFYEKRNRRSLSDHWNQRVSLAVGWQLEVEKRFVLPCTCQPVQLPDRFLISGEDDCPVHGFGSIENERE